MIVTADNCRCGDLVFLRGPVFAKRERPQILRTLFRARDPWQRWEACLRAVLPGRTVLVVTLCRIAQRRPQEDLPRSSQVADAF